MKFLIKYILLNFIFCLFTFSLFGQLTVQGKVLDQSNGEPLIGANVLIENSSEGTVTDYDGTFEFTTQEELPFTLVVSYVGYGTKNIEVTDLETPKRIELVSDAMLMDVVEVKGQRISDKQKAAPLTVESLDVLAIKETPSDNFYDGLGSLKGVDLTAASLGFKVINTRGFNSTSPVRSLQIIDGVDNQAPGLNFSLGNFLGSSELDVVKVDIIVGASSAFYGPNAFNGVISMETKNPFYSQGLSASVKAGERNLIEGALRWADAFQNKQGQDFLAYKVNLSHLRADDWVADNYDPVDNSRVPADNPGRFDAVNIYGDEYQTGNDFSTFEPWTYPGLGIWYRTGYQEVDLVDYDTRNTKANLAVHLRTQPEKQDASPELIFSSNFGAGTTVYQGDNRFSLRNILFFQNRLEYRKRDKFFLRAYATRDNAGDSYDPYFTALKLQERSKLNRKWSQDYVDYWLAEIRPQFTDLGYPSLEIVPDPDEPGNFIISFDRKAADAWLEENKDLVTAWHEETEMAANMQTNPSTTVDFFQPGTERFQQEFENIRSTLRTEGGTQFFDQSSLYHVHGEYIFTPEWTDKITVGGNARLYTPESRGTVFYDTSGVEITNSEFGFYGGIEKKFAQDELTGQFTIRTDKNENFDWLVSPAASLVWNPTENNYLRVSFSSAIRNPTLTDQYLFLDVGRAILSGNLNGVEGLITVESLREYLKNPRPGILEFFDIDPVRPEQVRTIEGGYRATLFGNTYIDANYYYSFYTNFLGFNLGVEATFDDATGLPRRLQVFRYAANSENRVTTQGFSIGVNHYFQRYYMLSANYSWNQLNKTFEDDPIIPAFNTPEHKYNISLSGRDIQLDLGLFTLRNFGFNVNYKWIEGFLFEGSPQFTGFIPTYDLLDAQMNYRFEKINTTLKVGASNLLDNRSFQTYGGPRIGRLAYISLVYEQNQR